MKYVVVCHDPNDKPLVYGPFTSNKSAVDWIERTAQEAREYGNDPCPNDHDIIPLNEISEG